jgi:hypothetical protein
MIIRRFLTQLISSLGLLTTVFASPILTCDSYPAQPGNPSNAVATFSLFFDGSTTPLSSPAVINSDGTQSLSFNLGGFQQGAHTVTAEAINAAGVTSPMSKSFSFNLSLMAPVLAFNGPQTLVADPWPWTEILSGTMDWPNYFAAQFHTSDKKISYVWFYYTVPVSNTESTNLRITVLHPNAVSATRLDLATLAVTQLPLVTWDNGTTVKVNATVTSHASLIIVQ